MSPGPTAAGPASVTLRAALACAGDYRRARLLISLDYHFVSYRFYWCISLWISIFFASLRNAQTAAGAARWDMGPAAQSWKLRVRQSSPVSSRLAPSFVCLCLSLCPQQQRDLAQIVLAMQPRPVHGPSQQHINCLCRETSTACAGKGW